MTGRLAKIRESRLIPFLFAGGMAAAANFCSRFLFRMWVSYEVAIVLAYIVGMIVAFTLMRGKVFRKADGRLFPQIFKFCAVNVLSILQTLLISIVLVSHLFPAIGFSFHSEAIAHAIGIMIPVLVSFFLHRSLTFR